jgi:hypothetical protein
VEGAEEIGQLAHAAAAARVLDAGSDARPSPAAHGHGAACLNCGTTLEGEYCHACGQTAHVHRSVGHVFEELLHGISHFDSRFWRTIPLLLVRPGKLTRDYVMGKRQRYIAPVSLFLLTIFTMFLVFGFTPGPSVPDGALEVDGKAAAEVTKDLRLEVQQLEAKLAAAKADPARAGEVAGLEMAAAVARTALARSERVKVDGRYKSSGGSLSDIVREQSKANNINVNTGNPEWDAKAKKALANPEFVFYKMKQKGYKLSFLLLPMSIPWMLLLFAWKKDVKVYDHFVFLLYSISFMSLLFIAVVGLATVGNVSGGVWTAVLLLPFAHMLVQLKEAYALSWFSALWRATLLSTLAVLTLSLYFILILLLGLID